MEPQFRPVSDRHTDSAAMLGHGRTVDSLQAYLEAADTRGPMCIALHGEWGCGKTSILRTLEGRLREKGSLDVLFFEAWKYEYSSPAVGLVSELAHKYHGEGGREAVSRVVNAALRVASNKLLSTSLDEIAGALSGGPLARSLSDSLAGVLERRGPGKKLAIMIDDLDRCDPENVLQTLSLVKLFLEVDGCVCIAAVDLARLRQAWEARYGAAPGGAAGAAGAGGAYGAGDAVSYLEKMFQMSVPVPVPSREQMAQYVNETVGSAGRGVAGIVASFVRRNPRSVKRVLNSACYRERALGSAAGGTSALLWTLLEGASSEESACAMHSELAARGSSLGALLSGAGTGAGPDAAQRAVAEALGRDPTGPAEKGLARLLSMAGPIMRECGAAQAALDADFDALRAAAGGRA